jgi:hypothetical protein
VAGADLNKLWKCNFFNIYFWNYHIRYGIAHIAEMRCVYQKHMGKSEVTNSFVDLGSMEAQYQNES